MAAGDAIDFTAMPPNSHWGGRPIRRCPACGRNGQQATYSDGAMFAHSATERRFSLDVHEHCYIPKETP